MLHTRRRISPNGMCCPRPSHRFAGRGAGRVMMPFRRRLSTRVKLIAVEVLLDPSADRIRQPLQAAGGENRRLFLVEAPAVAVLRQQVGDLQPARQRGTENGDVRKAPAQLRLEAL